ncbi:MAG: hypothetical protein WDN44_05150 [Sphingomonas sp.]
MLEHVVDDDEIERPIGLELLARGPHRCIAIDEGHVDLVARIDLGEPQPFGVDVDAHHLGAGARQFDAERAIGAADVEHAQPVPVERELVLHDRDRLLRAVAAVDLEGVAVGVFLKQRIDALDALCLGECLEKMRVCHFTEYP